MSELEVQNQSAVYYEKRYSGYGLKYHRQVIDWMMEGVWPDHRILDAGCGTGIIKRLYPTHHLVGVDISDEMVKRCPEYPQPYALVGTVSHLQLYPDFDAVLCRSILHHLPDHKKALSEFHRVLKPGGRLVAWETNKGWLAQKVRARTQHGDRFSEYHHAFRPGELEFNIKDAGFEIEEVRYMGFVAYPLFGFPDIIPMEDYIPFKPILFPLTLAVDYMLESIPWVNKMSWAVGIKAKKI